MNDRPKRARDVGSSLRPVPSTAWTLRALVALILAMSGACSSLVPYTVPGAQSLGASRRHAGLRYAVPTDPAVAAAVAGDRYNNRVGIELEIRNTSKSRIRLLGVPRVRDAQGVDLELRTVTRRGGIDVDGAVVLEPLESCEYAAEFHRAARRRLSQIEVAHDGVTLEGRPVEVRVRLVAQRP